MHARFSVDEFSPVPQSTPDYDQWWGLYYGRYFINARSALKRIKPFTSPIKGKSVGQGEQDELHSQQSVEPKLLMIEENKGSLDGLPMSTAQVQSLRPRSRKKKSRARRGKGNRSALCFHRSIFLFSLTLPSYYSGFPTNHSFADQKETVDWDPSYRGRKKDGRSSSFQEKKKGGIYLS